MKKKKTHTHSLLKDLDKNPILSITGFTVILQLRIVYWNVVQFVVALCVLVLRHIRYESTVIVFFSF